MMKKMTRFQSVPKPGAAADHLNLLLEIGQLDWVFKDSSTIDTLLGKIVVTVAARLQADVCSIFIYDDVKDELILKANTGLKRNVVGRIRLKSGEGIAGSVFETQEPVLLDDGFTHPKFRFFKGSGEERYRSFLSVPIIGGTGPLGVMTLQRKDIHPFTDIDLKTLQVVASQLATVLENVRIIQMLRRSIPAETLRPTKKHLVSVFLKGKAASRGYAYAKASPSLDMERFQELIRKRFDRKYRLADLKNALKKTETELETLQKAVESKLSDAASMIFTAHLLILKDRGFVEGMVSLVQRKKNAPEAVIAVAQKYIARFQASPEPYIREKAHDIEDLAVRIIRNLAGKEAKLPPLRNRIVLAHDLYPSDLLKLSAEGVKGIVLSSGGVASHVAILARSLRIPMVIVNDPRAADVTDGDAILIDAELGNIFINPSKDILREFRDKIDQAAAVQVQPVMRPLTTTKDGVRISLLANVNLIKDLDALKKLSCDGIGLYRSEFPFIIRQTFPTEEEQFFVYQKLVQGAPGGVITFRTLDIGGDKMPGYLETVQGGNNFLGLRSIRYSLKNKDIFIQQIRAILRAGASSNLRIMFPLVCSLEEFRQAKSIVCQCIESLSQSKVPFCDHPEIGMMVEVPAAVEIIEDFAREVDFFSIGTNDLVQYMLAVDRTNEAVGEYYLPHHPAVLRAIKRVADAGLSFGKDVSVCGDMANQKEYLKFLIGCGIRKVSMNTVYLAENQKAIADIDAAQAAETAKRLLSLCDLAAVERELFGR